MTSLVLSQMIAAAILFYVSFCRLVRTTRETRLLVRWAIWSNSVAAAMLMLAPVAPIIYSSRFTWAAWDTPDWVWITMLVAIVLAQIAQAHFWAIRFPPRLTRRNFYRRRS